MYLHHKILHTNEQFENLREIWQTIYQKSECSYFSSFYWNYYWLKYFNNGYYLSIIVVYHRDKPVAILPLYYRKLSFFFRKYFLLASDVVASDYLDFLCLPEYVPTVRMYCRRILSRGIIGWSIFHLKDFTRSSFLYSLLLTIRKQHVNISAQPKDYCPYLILPEKVDNLFSIHSKKTASRFRAYLRSAFKRKDVNFYVGYLNDNPEETLRIFINLHLQRKAEQNLRSHFSEHNFVSFHRDIVRECRDSVYFFWLFESGRPIAVLYCYRKSNNIYFYNSGFDCNCTIKKPGYVLFYKVFEYLKKHGLERFYFLRGQEQYKYFWTKDEDELFYAELFSSTVSKIFNKLVLSYGK